MYTHRIKNRNRSGDASFSRGMLLQSGSASTKNHVMRLAIFHGFVNTWGVCMRLSKLGCRAQGGEHTAKVSAVVGSCHPIYLRIADERSE